MRAPQNDIRFDRPLYIRELQQMLRVLSFDDNRIPLISVDGIFGQETADAVSAAQIQLQLKPTGAVDFATWTAIVNASRAVERGKVPPLSMPVFEAGQSPVQIGEECISAACAQLMCCQLAKRFGNFNEVPLTGVLDEATANELKTVQRIHNRPVTGQLDRDTWDALTHDYMMFRSKESV